MKKMWSLLVIMLFALSVILTSCFFPPPAPGPPPRPVRPYPGPVAPPPPPPGYPR